MQVFIVPDGLIISSKFARQYNGLILILVNEIPHYGDRERIFFPRIPLFSKGSELEVSGRQKYVSKICEHTNGRETKDGGEISYTRGRWNKNHQSDSFKAVF